MGSIGVSTNTVQSYIDSWKRKESDAVVGELNRYRDKWLEWNEKETFADRTMLERNVPSIYLPIIKRNYATEEAKNNVFRKTADALINDHFEALKDKVEAKIGTITNIKNIGGANDYDITGSSGDTVRIQVVMAGGYNKQRLHTRWVMNKVGKK